MDVHEACELAQVAGLDCVLAFCSEFFDEMQIVHHRLIHRLRFLVLLLQDVRRGARVSREEKQEIVLEIRERFLGQPERHHFDSSAGTEVKAGHPAECGDVLILFADGFVQAVDFHLARLRGEFARMNDVALVRVQRLEQRGGETPAGAEAGACWDVRHRGDFERRFFLDAGDPHGFADDGMLNLADAMDALHVRIF